MAMVFHPGLNAPARPRVSVCIANFDGETLLPGCIESLLAQDTDTSIEIIVHDDASRDASVALLRERWPQAHLLASDTNVGFCVANNRMANAARGEYLLLLNNDAALHDDAMRTLLAEAERLSAPAILTLPQYDWDTGVLVDRGCLLDPFHVPVPNLDPSRRDIAYAIGACLFLPRTLWRELGGFPSWFGSIAEDMYLCCAARLAGYPVRCVDGSGYRHRQGASFGGNRIDGGRLHTRYSRRYLSERNRIAVLAACTPTWLAWPWLALHMTAMGFEGIALCIAYRSARPWRDICWPALRDAWRQRGELLTLRQHTQGRRRVRLRPYLQVFVPMPQKLALLSRHGMPGLQD